MNLDYPLSNALISRIEEITLQYGGLQIAAYRGECSQEDFTKARNRTLVEFATLERLLHGFRQDIETLRYRGRD